MEPPSCSATWSRPAARSKKRCPRRPEASAAAKKPAEQRINRVRENFHMQRPARIEGISPPCRKRWTNSSRKVDKLARALAEQDAAGKSPAASAPAPPKWRAARSAQSGPQKAGTDAAKSLITAPHENEDRILETSLALFNTEGEAHTTTIDIANEMDISPAISITISRVRTRLSTSCSNSTNWPGQHPDRATGATLNAERSQVEDNWYYLYVVMEEMYQYRFLYYNLDDIPQRYPDIRKGFKRLIQLKRAALFAICQNLLQQDVIAARDQQLLGLVDNMTLTLTFWFNYDQLLHRAGPEITIHQGVLQLLTMVAPYLGDNELSFYRNCETIFTDLLQQAG